MKADPHKIRPHLEAVDAFIAESGERLTAMVSAQSALVALDRSPMREMALQALAKSIVAMEKANGCLTTYSRSLNQYIAEQDR